MERMRNVLARLVQELAIVYSKVIQQGCQEEVFKTETPLESAELLLAGIQFLTDDGIYPWSKKDLIRRKKAIPQLIEAQLRIQK